MRPLIFLVAGEASGDAIGGKLIRALKKEHGNPLGFAGVGGRAMQALPQRGSSDPCARAEEETASNAFACGRLILASAFPYKGTAPLST